MSFECEITGKKTTFGRSIRHKAGGGWFRRAPVTSRTFKPNLQHVTLMVDGVPTRMRISTRALRTLQKETKGHGPRMDTLGTFLKQKARGEKQPKRKRHR